MRFWFQKKTQLIPVYKDSSKVRLHEWRGESSLVSSAQKVLGSPDFRLMFQVIQNEHPSNQIFNPTVPEHVRAAHQAKSEGYTLCLANIEALGIIKKTVEIGQPSYEPELVEKE